MELMVFSKHLTGLPLSEVGRRLAEMDIHAIDLTVRPGGHVDPERVEQDLPRAAEDLAQSGVRIGMITTAITEANALARRILAMAVQVGIRHYKLGYYNYKGFGTLKTQRAEVAAKLKELAALNAESGIHGGFHNHSADFFGASLWDIAYVLEGTPRAALGLYFDPAHAHIEGGSDGWLMGMDLLQDRLSMLAVKDYYWAKAGRGYGGGRQHAAQWCPLEEGNTPWPEVLRCLLRINFEGPISLHSEYQGAHSFRDLSVDEVFNQTARDAALFKTWIEKAAENK